MNSYTRQFLFIFLFLEVVFTSASEPFCVTYYIGRRQAYCAAFDWRIS